MSTGLNGARAAVIGALAITAAVTATTLATTPGSDGQIAFRRWLNDDTSRSALFTINPDGTGVRQIVPRLRGAHDDQPDWSPDGRLLAFSRFPDDGPAWINVVKGCRHVHLSPTDEDIEGSFDNDVLIGDAGPNMLLGQPGVDSYFGRGGDDTIVAADGVKDWYIQCGLDGRPEGRAIVDPIDPAANDCATVGEGTPVAGLHK